MTIKFNPMTAELELQHAFSPSSITRTTFMKDDEIRDFPANGIIDLDEYLQSTRLTKIDWLSCTTNSTVNFELFYSELSSILSEIDVSISHTARGMQGWNASDRLMLWLDNEYLVVGTVAYQSVDNLSNVEGNRGGMLQFTGRLCSLLQLNFPHLWVEICDLIKYHKMRLTRVDIALDLPYSFLQKVNLNVPKIYALQYTQQIFRSGHSRNGQASTLSQAGDWSPFIVGTCNAQTYNPLKDCPQGLTFYVGSRTSPNFFRVYEKGKQLLALYDDRDPTIDQGLVRIEQEFKRDKDGNDISYEILVLPDRFFMMGRLWGRDLLDKYASFLGSESPLEFLRGIYKKERSLSLQKKVYWARRSYGRTIATLYESGFDEVEIVGMIMRNQVLKDYIPDIAFKESVNA